MLRLHHQYAYLMNEQFLVEDLGLIDYQQAYEHQRRVVQEVIDGAIDHLILCEHPAVITVGRMTNPNSLLYSKQDLQSEGVQLYPIDRGGDVTLHAPGQLVVYVIMNLNGHGRDLKHYMQQLQQLAVDLLKDFGILAVSIEGQRGVYSNLDKIVSIGVGVRRWVTYHGLGINVNTDLSLFRFIKPCGLDVQMTSMQKVLGKSVDMGDVKTELVKHFLKKNLSFP